MANCKNCTKKDVCKNYESKSTTACEHYSDPIRHGHWIICSDGYYPYCSVCKCEPKGREMTKFCGECGAKMDEENS